jgi:hypothetical protein
MFNCDLAREVFDPAGLDPQLFDGAEAGFDVGVYRLPCFLIPPIGLWIGLSFATNSASALNRCNSSRALRRSANVASL